MPDAFARIGPWEGSARFLFDERISERVTGGTLDDAVVVSPRTGEVHVEHGRREISVRVDGGFQAGIAYRVTLLPVVSDLFGNRMQNAFELVFSTGPEPVPTAVAGVVWDRITGQGVAGLEVRAASPSQSVEHVAVTGTSGIYAFRYLPSGNYRLMAFEDLNRNDEIDVMERRGLAQIELTGVDTVLADIAVLEPDTTRAELVSLSALDSLTVVLEMDDYIDPSAPIEDFAVLVERESGEPGPAVERLFREHEYAAFVEEVRDSLMRLDSLDAARAADRRRAAADTVPADTLLVPDSLAGPDTTALADTAELARPRAAPGRQGPPALSSSQGGGAVPAGRGPLPGTRLVVRLQSPLEPGVLYRVIAAGVINLNELPEGGGIDTLRVVPADTAGAAPRGRGR